MGPVRQNPIQRTVSLFICVCIALCTIVAHNITQNRPDSFPPYPPELEERIAASEAMLAQKEGVGSLRDSDDRDEQKKSEMRQNNMIIYHVDEIDSEWAEDRKAGDA